MVRCKEICMVQLCRFWYFWLRSKLLQRETGCRERPTNDFQLDTFWAYWNCYVKIRSARYHVVFCLLLKRLPAAWNALMYARLYHPLSSLSLSFVLSSLMSFNVFKVNPHDVCSDLGIGTLTCTSKTSKNCRLDRAIGNMKLLWHPATLSCNSRPTWTHLQILSEPLSIAFHLCLFCAFGSLLPAGIPPGRTYTDLSVRDTIAGAWPPWPHSPGNSDLQLRSICNFLIKDRQCRHLQWLGLINAWPEFKHY